MPDTVYRRIGIVVDGDYVGIAWLDDIERLLPAVLDSLLNHQTHRIDMGSSDGDG